MSMQDDELIFGTDGGRSRDSDGDGVTDVQERLDGTDPNDAADSIRHDKPIVGLDGDPRGDLDLATLGNEVIVDVAANVPAGHTIEQGLPVGLDGKPLPTGPKHYGNADADKMFDGHPDANSPLDMERDPLAGNTPAKPNQGTGGKDGISDTAGAGSDSKVGGNNHSTPPPGADLSFRAPHPEQVSARQLQPFDESKHKGPDVDPSDVPKATLKDFDAEPPSWWEQKKAEWKELWGGGSGDGMDNLGAAGNKKKEMVDPDAGGTGVDGVVPSDGSVERAILVAGGATDFVEGYGGGPQIEGDAPPERLNLVVNGGDGSADDPTEGTFGATGTVTPPGQEISKPVNPQDDLLGGLSPTAGAGGNTGGGGDGGDNTGRVGVSNAATAADAPTSPSGVGGGSGVTNIGGGSSGGGINTLAGDDVTGLDTGPATDDSGRATQSSAMMAGDDDDLEELEVQRADMAAAGPGTQTEDEIYIGATSAPVDPTGGASDGGSGGGPPGGDVANADVPPMPVGTVAGVIAPILELEVEDAVPAPLDPVADAMVTVVAPFEAHAATFTIADGEVDLSIPDEPDLDDGL